MNGKTADPLYTFLRSNKGGLLGDSIKWNFTKFLVDREGKVVDRYAPTTTPLSIEVNLILLFIHLAKFDPLKTYLSEFLFVFIGIAEGYKEAAWCCISTKAL